MAAHYTFSDHSGLKISKIFDNPYDGLIEQCNNDPAEIQAVYQRHRVNRNAQQKAKLLEPDFEGVVIDEILSRLENPKDYPRYVDPRHCLVFWARPTAQLRALISEVQQKLLAVLPSLWIMPSPSLHMTALEVTHSLTAEEIESLLSTLAIQVTEIADYTQDHRARVVRPMLSYDAQAFALSFLPAASESYTYHHLRRDLFNKVQSSGVKVESRYVVPSAHLTVGRYVSRQDLETDGVVDATKMHNLVEVIEDINQWLETDHIDLQWLVGQERGLTCRKGPLWYGSGGETVYDGQGF